MNGVMNIHLQSVTSELTNSQIEFWYTLMVRSSRLVLLQYPSLHQVNPEIPSFCGKIAHDGLKFYYCINPSTPKFVPMFIYGGVLK